MPPKKQPGSTTGKTTRQTKHYYILLNSGEWHQCKSKKEKDLFEKEYKNIIKDVLEFNNKEKMDEYIKSIIPVTTTPTKKLKTDNDINLTPEQKIAFDKACTYLEEASEVNKICINYKTTSTSKACIVILKQLDSRGEDMWFWKAENFVTTIVAYTKSFPQENDTLQELLINFKKRVTRDKKGPDTQPKKLQYTPRKNKNEKPIDYIQYTAVTHFTIDLTKITNEEQEQQYIVKTCKNLAILLKNTQKNNIYLALLQKTTSPGLWDVMMKTNGSQPNFIEYMESCRESIKKIDNLNEFVTRDECNELTNLLWDHRVQNISKYDQEEETETSNDETENHDTQTNNVATTTH